MLYKVLYEEEEHIIIECPLEISTHKKKGGGIVPASKGVEADFIKNREVYMEHFKKYWNLEDSLLDYSPKSLDIIDRLYVSIRYDDTKMIKIDFPKLAMMSYFYISAVPKEIVWGMAAYVGEVIIREVNGNWVMREWNYTCPAGDINFNIIDPVVIGNDGTEYNFFYLIISFLSTGNDFYVAPRVLSEIEENRRNKKSSFFI